MSTRGLGVALAALAVWMVAAAVPPASADSCPNAVFRTGPSASLPDCRAYELVTPPFKAGGVVFIPPALSGATDGSNLMIDSLGGFGEPGDNGNANGSNYLVERTASGWVSTPLDPSLSQVLLNGESEADVSRGFRRSLFVRTPRSSTPVDQRFYIREPDGSFVEVGPGLSPAVVAALQGHREAVRVAYEGGSADLSHLLFSVESGGRGTLNRQLQVNSQWPGDGTVIGQSLYEYVGIDNSVPQPVGVDNEGHQIGQCGTYLGADQSGPLGAFAEFNAVSASGASVFFSVAEGGCVGELATAGLVGSGPSVVEVYARVDGSRTVAISEPSAGDCTACDTTPAQRAPAVFQGASRDGSKVFFLTSQPLLGGESTRNLYLYDFAAPAGQRVVRVSAGDIAGASVEGVAGISQDGSHVYFVAQGVLTSVPNDMGQRAEEGNNNLYVHEADPAHPGQSVTVFVTALAGGDEGDWGLADNRRPVQVTPDGRFLAFSSRNDLTPDCATCAGSQLYRFDAQTGALVRISIGEDGFNEDGADAGSPSLAPVSHSHSLAAQPAVSISDDGEYVFFRSRTALTTKALNDVCLGEASGECVVYAQNVYEYHEGHVYLISDGQDRHVPAGGAAVRLIGGSPSGGDVFFTTVDPLVEQDTDTQLDVYDARVAGGFLPPAVAPSCEGEACQGGLLASPSAQIPGSFAFTGPGNPPVSPATVKEVTKKRHVTKKKKKTKRHRRAKSRRTDRKGR